MKSAKKLISLLLVFSMIFSLGGEALAEVLRLPDRLTVIEEEAFSAAQALDVVDIPLGTESIDSRAFADSGARQVYIPGTVTWIADDAFSGTEAVICSPAGSYAREFADSHGLQWLNCGNHYGQEQANFMAEWSAEMQAYEAPEPLELERFLSAEDVTDEEVLKLIEEHNRLVEDVNQRIDAVNNGLESFYSSLQESTSLVTVSDTDQSLIYTYDSWSLTSEHDALDRISPATEFVSAVLSENNNYIVLTDTEGKQFYMTRDGGSVKLLSSPPIETRSIGAALPGIRAASPMEVYEKTIEEIKRLFSLIAYQIENWLNHANLEKWYLEADYKKFQEMANANEREIENLRKIQADIKNELAGIENQQGARALELKAQQKANAQNLAACDKIAKSCSSKLRGLLKMIGIWDGHISLINGLNVCFKSINLLFNLLDAYSILRDWREISRIRDEGHPTYRDTGPLVDEICDELNRNITYAMLFYETDVLMVALNLYVALMSFTTGAITLTWPVVLSLYVASAALSSGKDRYYKAVKDTDRKLHTFVSGRVRDKDTGIYLQGVAVTTGTTAVVTDRRGAYEIPVYPEDSQLIFTHPEYKKDAFVLTVTIGNSITVGDRLLQRALFEVIGKVTDKKTNKGLPGVSVTSGQYTAVTDSDGMFSIMLPEGEQVLQYARLGYKSESLRFTVVRDAPFGRVASLALTPDRGVIYNRQELEAVADYPDEDYVLGADIDLSEAPWTPIPNFSGHFDGNGHSIGGMRVTQNNSDAQYAGLFGYMNGGTVENVTLWSSTVTVTNPSGFVSATLLGTPDNLFDFQEGNYRFVNCTVQGRLTLINSSEAYWPNAFPLACAKDSSASVDITIESPNYHGGMLWNCEGCRGFGNTQAKIQNGTIARLLNCKSCSSSGNLILSDCQGEQCSLFAVGMFQCKDCSARGRLEHLHSASLIEQCNKCSFSDGSLVTNNGRVIFDSHNCDASCEISNLSAATGFSMTIVQDNTEYGGNIVDGSLALLPGSTGECRVSSFLGRASRDNVSLDLNNALNTSNVDISLWRRDELVDEFPRHPGSIAVKTASANIRIVCNLHNSGDITCSSSTGSVDLLGGAYSLGFISVSTGGSVMLNGASDYNGSHITVTCNGSSCNVRGVDGTLATGTPVNTGHLTVTSSASGETGVYGVLGGSNGYNSGIITLTDNSSTGDSSAGGIGSSSGGTNVGDVSLTRPNGAAYAVGAGGGNNYGKVEITGRTSGSVVAEGGSGSNGYVYARNSGSGFAIARNTYGRAVAESQVWSVAEGSVCSATSSSYGLTAKNGQYGWVMTWHSGYCGCDRAVKFVGSSSDPSDEWHFYSPRARTTVTQGSLGTAPNTPFPNIPAESPRRVWS